MDFRPLHIPTSSNSGTHTPTSSSGCSIQMKNENDDWHFLEDTFKSILAGVDTSTISYDELYRRAYLMVTNKRGGILYEGVRKIVTNHVRRLAGKLQARGGRPDNNTSTSNFLMDTDNIWNEFSEMMEKIRSILLYSERVYEHSIGGESIINFGWRVFRMELLENEIVKSKLMVKPMLMNPIQKASLDSLKNIKFDGSIVESPVVSADVLLDIMGFLEAFHIGLKLSLVSRQLAFLTDYVLNKKKHILSPLMICDGHEEGLTFAYAVPLKRADDTKSGDNKKKMTRILDGWAAALESSNRFPLPKVGPPKWIVGVQMIYLTDGLNNEIISFLSSIRPQLQNCHLIFNFSYLWDRLRESNLLWTFLSLFNECAFSISHSDVPKINCSGCYLNENKRMTIQWPLWALFNNIFFTECRELHLSLDLINSSQNGLEASKWLQHQSTEKRPRKLKLYTDYTNWHLMGSRGVTTMLEAIKDNFQNSHRKRTFFVELPMDGLHNRVWGEWLNQIGEQLLVDQLGIRRAALEDGLKQFEDFYPHLSEAATTKVLICTYKWVKRVAIPGTPVAVRRSTNNPTPVATRRSFAS